MMRDFNVKNHAADHHNVRNRGSLLMRDRKPAGSLLWAVLLVVAATFGFNGCGNVNDVSVPNNAPVANAGPDLGSIIVGTVITMNGSASTDPNGDPLTYSWSLITKPAGSAAVLVNPTSVTPTFTVDRVGDYVVQLIVNDGGLNSAPDTAIISTNNVAPVANAGPDQGGIAPGSLVTLDGSASSDGDGDPLTYSWSLTAKPAGSAAVLANPTSVSPTFTVDLTGKYVAQLIVNDGTVNSAPDTVFITTVNVAPVANAGPDQGGIALGSLVTLDGSASSDANGDPLTYSWSLTAKPAGSAAVLANPTSVSPTFTVDLHGTYTVQLIVNDGTLSSAPNTVNISTVKVTPVTITTDKLREGRRNRPYADTLAASGGIIPYTWSVTPALPAGLTLAPATGVISGIPTATSNINHDFTVRDSTDQTTTKELKLRIRD
jgi:hypothetical protein